MFQFSDDFDEEDFLCISVDELTQDLNNSVTVEQNLKDTRGEIEKTQIFDSNNSAIDFVDDDNLILPVVETVSSKLSRNEAIFEERVLNVTPVRTNLKSEKNYTNFNVSTKSVFLPHIRENDSCNKHKLPSVTTDSQSNTKTPKLECEQIFPRLKSGSKIEYERKFPGPAGLILKNKPRKSSPLENEFNDDELHHQVCIPATDDSLLEGRPWQVLIKDVTSKSGELLKIMNEYTAAAIKRKNIIENTSRKIPLFASVISHIDFSLLDPMITLKDFSGEIRGTVHKDLWEKYKHLLIVGSALLLRQVSLLSFPHSRKLYLNITGDTLNSIYTLDKDGKLVEVTRVAPAIVLQKLLDEGNELKSNIFPEISKNRSDKITTFSKIEANIPELAKSEVNKSQIPPVSEVTQFTAQDLLAIRNELEGLDVDSIFCDF